MLEGTPADIAVAFEGVCANSATGCDHEADAGEPVHVQGNGEAADASPVTAGPSSLSAAEAAEADGAATLDDDARLEEELGRECSEVREETARVASTDLVMNGNGAVSTDELVHGSETALIDEIAHVKATSIAPADHGEDPVAMDERPPSSDTTSTCEPHHVVAESLAQRVGARLDQDDELATQGQDSEAGEAGNHDPVERLRCENAALVNDVGTLKAKFELTLRTMRSILCLGSEASWADILEHCEDLALKVHGLVGDVKAEGTELSDAQIRDEELRQAEVEIEQLEEKVEAQTAHIARLRELLQKQQGLLDMTAQQFETQHAQSEEQTEKIKVLEDQNRRLEETRATQQVQNEDLSRKSEVFHAQLQEQTLLVERQSQDLDAQAVRIADLEDALRASGEEFQRQAEDGERLRSEAQLESERQEERNRTLEETLGKQGELIDKMSDQLQVFEAADRRRFSYRTEARSNRAGGAEEEHSVAGSEHNSVCSSRPGRPSLRPGDGPSTPGDGDTIGALSAASTPLPSSRGPRGQHQQQQVNSTSKPPSPANSIGSVPLTAMSEKERMRFLAHFPMASRTERQFRNRLEERRKVRTPGSAGA